MMIDWTEKQKNEKEKTQKCHVPTMHKFSFSSAWSLHAHLNLS